MLPLSSALLGLSLLAPPGDATAESPLPTCEAGTRHIELRADAPGRQWEVCIRPGLSTTLVFDSKVARMVLAGRERFQVMEGDFGLTLLPTQALADGERVTLSLFFEDGAAPEGVTFALVVHPSQAERQVEVTRHPRTRASYQLGEQQAREEARQCREDKARLQAACGGQGGLMGLLANGLMGERGIPRRGISRDVTVRPGSTLRLNIASSYSAVGRVALELQLWNTGTDPWTPARAALVPPGEEALTVLAVWPPEPIPPQKEGRVWVEAAATEGQARNTFTLKLWGAESGARDVTLEGITFP